MTDAHEAAVDAVLKNDGGTCHAFGKMHCFDDPTAKWEGRRCSWCRDWAGRIVDAVLVDELRWEWTLVIDGDPRMDGTHERREVGRFKTLDEAKRGYATITGTMRLPSDEIRIERRQVGPWEVVE